MRTITRYSNGGLPKIYDDAMLWILFGFLELPFATLRTALHIQREGFGFHLLQAWRMVYARQMQVWRWL